MYSKVLVASCTNRIEPDGTPCPGRLRFHWGQVQAACDTCGAWCGISVAAWLSVEPEVSTEPKAVPEDEKEHCCKRCGSTEWVSVSLNGGYTRTAQCVPCGAYGDKLGPGWKAVG